MINVVILIILWVLWNINIIVIIIINNINLLNILPRPVKTDTCDTCEKMVVEIRMASTAVIPGRKEQLELAYDKHKTRANMQISKLKMAEKKGPKAPNRASGWRTICTSKKKFFWSLIACDFHRLSQYLSYIYCQIWIINTEELTFRKIFLKLFGETTCFWEFYHL